MCKKRWCIKVIESERDSDEREKMAEEVEKRKEEKGVPAAYSREKTAKDNRLELVVVRSAMCLPALCGYSILYSILSSFPLYLSSPYPLFTLRSVSHSHCIPRFVL